MLNKIKSEVRKGLPFPCGKAGRAVLFFLSQEKTGKRFRESFTNIEGNKRKLQKQCEKHTKFECSI